MDTKHTMVNEIRGERKRGVEALIGDVVLFNAKNDDKYLRGKVHAR